MTDRVSFDSYLLSILLVIIIIILGIDLRLLRPCPCSSVKPLGFSFIFHVSFEEKWYEFLLVLYTKVINTVESFVQVMSPTLICETFDEVFKVKW